MDLYPKRIFLNFYTGNFKPYFGMLWFNTKEFLIDLLRVCILVCLLDPKILCCDEFVLFDRQQLTVKLQRAWFCFDATVGKHAQLQSLYVHMFESTGSLSNLEEDVTNPSGKLKEASL